MEPIIYYRYCIRFFNPYYMKIFRLLSVLMIFGLVLSCTENDKPLKLKKLTLRHNLSSNNVPIHQEVEFRLKGDDYLDYTEEMTLEIDGVPVDGYTFIFDQTGEFEVKAIVGNLSSNTINFTVSEGMILSHKSLLKNQVNTFTLYDVSTGEDISTEGTFYVNGEAINSNTFNSDTPGTYEVYAEYFSENGETLTTDPESFTVVAPVQRALIEDYTGTWCGYCPRLQGIIGEVHEMTDHVTSIAIHKSSGGSNADPYEYEYVDDLAEVYNPYGEYPKGLINRTIPWNDNDANTVLEYVGGESNIGIAAKTKFNGTQLSVDVRVASTSSLSNHKIVVASLENHLFHDQTNYLNNDETSPWYGQGNPIPDYENNHVLRHAMTNIFGDPIPQTEALTDFKKSYEMNMTDYFEVPEDGEVAIFVLDTDGNVLQVQELGLNDSVEFE